MMWLILDHGNLLISVLWGIGEETGHAGGILSRDVWIKHCCKDSIISMWLDYEVFFFRIL